MAVALLFLLVAAPSPEIPVKTGAPIRLDAKLEEAEWADAYSVAGDRPDGGKIRLRLKRTGPWLALGIDAEQAYRGEILKLFVTDATGAWITHLALGLGQPTLPPGVWKRGAPDRFDDPDLGPGGPARACLVRLDVKSPERWSAEALVRLSGLGIGRGDLRDFRGIVQLEEYDPLGTEVLALPAAALDPHVPAQYGRLVSEDGWGASETWPPVTETESKELDDGDLLHRLCLEHAKVVRAETPDLLLIANAVRARSAGRIGSLRRQIEAGLSRNPTLPAWTYFLGRLLHSANLYDEARQVIESVPEPLRTLAPFATLAAEHFLDTEQFDHAVQICRACPYILVQETLLKLALEGKRQQEAEQEAIAKDEAKEEKNPRVRLRTTKGEITIELFEDDAPGIVRNFMDLVLKRRFYDGLRFHEVHGARVAFLGDPRTRIGATETRPGPGWRLRAEKSTRGLLRGYLLALPLGDGKYHGSQFLIALAPMVSEKDRTFSFGRVVEGMDVLLSVEQDDLVERVEVISRRNHAYDASAARMDR